MAAKYPDDNTNSHVTAIMVVLKVFPQIMREMICNDFPPQTVIKLIENNKKYKANITEVKMSNLRSHGYDNLDISFLYHIIRLLSLLPEPNQGWGNSPLPEDKNKEDDVERMKNSRNDIIHRRLGDISESMLNEFLKESLEIAKRMDDRIGYPKKFFESKLEQIQSHMVTQEKYTEALESLAEYRGKLQETPEGPLFELYYDNNIHMKIVTNEDQDENGDSRSACTIYLRDPSIDANAVIQNIDAIKEIISKGDYTINLEGANRGSLKLHVTIHYKSFITKEKLHRTVQSFLHEFFLAASIPLKRGHIYTVVLTESDYSVEDDKEKSDFDYLNENPSPVLKLNVSVKDSAFQNEFVLYREVNSFISGMRNSINRDNVPTNGSAREVFMLANNETGGLSTPSSERNPDSQLRMAQVAEVSERESNYFKISTLLMRISPRAVRIKFDDVFHPDHLTDTLSLNLSKLTDLKDKRCINQTQWNSMFPRTDDPTSQSFDTTLMVCLLRNLAGIKIANKLPSSTDFSVGADLSRIKTYRKDIANSKDRTFQNEKFAAIWNETEACQSRRLVSLGSYSPAENRGIAYEAVIRLSSGKLQKDCSTLKTKTYDVADVRKIRTLIQDSKRLVRIEEINEVADRVEKIDFKQKSDKTQDCYHKGIEEWEEEKKWFVETNAFNFILNNLDERIFTVIGNPGMGKSMLMQQIALYLRDSKGYSILPCHSPSDIVNRFREETKQVFILDDVCGQFTIVHSYIEKWKQYQMRITKIMETKDSESIILASCRSQVFRELQDQQLIIFSGCLCNMDAGECATDNQQKLKIAKKYLSQKTISEIKQDLDCFDMFPLLCRLYKDRQTGNSISFFTDPFNFYKEELDRFRKEDHGIKCCTLLLCVIHSGFLNPAILMKEFESDFSKTLETIFEKFGLVLKTSRQSLIDSFDTLYTYLEKRNGHFNVLHGRLFDFLCYYFGMNFQQLIIDYADSEIIRDRTLLKSLRTTPFDFTILIDADYENEYFERLIKDMLSGYIDDVLYNHQIIHKVFRNKLLSHLQKLDDDDVIVTRVLSEYVLDENEKTSKLLPVNFACKYGYKELFDFFLSKTEDVNVYSGNNIPLITACRKQDKLMTRLLLDKGADVNQTDALGCTPLLWACVHGNLEIIQMLINEKADINKIEIRSNSSPLVWAVLGEFIQLIVSKDFNERILSSSHADEFFSFLIENVNEQFFTEERLIDGFLTLLQLGSLKGGIHLLESLLPSGKQNLQELKSKATNILKTSKAEETRTEDDATPLFIGIMNLFIDIGTDIDESSTGGITTLSFACNLLCLFKKGRSIRYLLSKGASINKPDIAGVYPLNFAISTQSEDLVRLFIEHGALVNYEVKGSTPLFEAINTQNISIINSLLNAKADINVCPDNTSTLLHYAIGFNNADLLITLLKGDISINCKDGSGNTPLMLAVNNGLTDIARVLINEGAIVNTWNSDKITPLMLAASKGYDEIVEKILKTKKAFTEYETPEPLFLACRNNHSDIVILLLNSGCDINSSEPKNGNTCLIEASGKGFESMVDLLLKNGANVNASNHAGDTPITIASMYGHAFIVRLLIERKANMYKVNKNGESSLFLACLYNKLKVVEVLIGYNYYIDNIETDKKQTCLSVSSYHGYDTIVAYLIKRRANVNIKSYIGNTPLMLAASKGYLNIVQMLIEHKADVNIRNEAGSTCLSLASSKGFDEIVAYLIKHRADVNTQSNIGTTPLILAASKGHFNIVKMLIENKADVNIQNDKGSTCLSLASSKGFDTIVTYLIHQRAIIDMANENGDSPLMLATKNGHASTVKILSQHGAKVNIKNKEGLSSFDLAIKFEHSEIADILNK